MIELTQQLAEKYARIALGHVSKEYPHKLDHVLTDHGDVRGPRALHPIFFGSFDWHSCVHAYWLLARLLRRFPTLEAAHDIEALFDERVTSENIAVEIAYVIRPASRGFERPYGWAWALALQAELDLHSTGACASAAKRHVPLSAAFAACFEHFLPIATYPVRSGGHTSTAFALRLAANYARLRNPPLFNSMRERTEVWYRHDKAAQAWEPGQDDFLSPTLMEAECMRAYLAPDEFLVWFDGFLPEAGAMVPATLFTPASVSDRTDGKIAHLDGLNLSRAWCWRAIASALPNGSPVKAIALDSASRHIEASMMHVSGDYMGEHWLATFAVLALDSL